MPVGQMLGGPTEVRNVDDDVRDLSEQVKEELQAKLGKDFLEFVPLVYRSQLVNGVNYFVKIRVDGDEHLHARIYKTFQGEVSLTAYQTNKSLDDKLEYFQ